MWTTLLNHNLLPVQWGAIIGASLAAAITDVISRRIPNWLTGPLLLTGLVFAGWVGGTAGVVESVAACLLLALPYVLLFVFAGGGAGDAKMMGAIGAWAGLFQGAVVLGSVALAGIVLALGYAIAKRRAKNVLLTVMTMFTVTVAVVMARLPLGGVLADTREREELITVPYGLAIFAGVLMAGVGILLCLH